MGNAAANVFVIGDNGEHGMEDMNIFANACSQLTLICVGESNAHGCAQSNIYLPNKADATLSIACYGFGCDNFYFYATQGMEALTRADLSMNGCDACADFTDCISLWYIYCNVWDNEIDEAFDHFVAFDGDSCYNADAQTMHRLYHRLLLLLMSSRIIVSKWQQIINSKRRWMME